MKNETKDILLTVGMAAGIGAVAWVLFGPRKASAADTVQFPDMVPPGTRVVLAGDSLAVGLAPALGKLIAEGGSDLTSIPKGGTAITQWAKDSKIQQIIESKPDLVLMSLATNDGAQSLSQLQSEAPMLEKLATAILGSGAKIVWILPAGRSEVTKKMAPNIDAAVEMIRSSPALVAAGVPMFDSSTLDGISLYDGIHAGTSGYEKWAAALYQFLRGAF